MKVRWSKLRARLRKLTSANVDQHLDVHVTMYRYTKEEDGRVWFTWDGVEVARFDDGRFWWRVLPLTEELRAVGADDAWERAIETTNTEANTDVSRFYASALSYLDQPIANALGSSDFVVRGLAMLDKRVGKRTLASLAKNEEANAFVRRMLALRREAEGLDA
ncbi:MAG: SF0329 family protein [bacterium]